MLATFSGRNPSQNEAELRGFCNLLNDEGVNRYAEIGAREGDTFVHVMESLPAGSYGVAVDLPGGLWGKSTTGGKLRRAINHLNGKGYRTSYILGDSKAEATRKLVKGRGPYDAILIDGDHTLVGVQADFTNYHRMAKLVAFHDIVGAGQTEKVSNQEVEVPVFWECVKHRHLNREFVDAGSKMGIGVLWM